MSERKQRRKRLPASVRRGIFVAVLLGLVGANAWVVRRQFPPRERQLNESYDGGLKALTDGTDYELAVAHFEKYLQVEPEKARVWYFLGVARKQLGRTADAEAAFRKAVEIDPEIDQARVGLAELALVDQDYARAVEQLTLAQKSEPTPSMVWVVEAHLRLELGDHQGAIASYQEAVQRDASSYASYLALGDLKMSSATLRGSMAEREAAASMYREAENICRTRLAAVDDKLLRMSLAKAIAGQARVLQDRSLDEAIEELRKVMALDPEDPEPALVLGQFFRQLGRLDEARRQVEAAAKKWKTRATLLALHDLYLDMAEPADAERALREGIDLLPDDPGLRIKLVGFLVSRERWDEAVTEVENAVALFGNDFQVREAVGDLWRERATAAASAGSLELVSEYGDKAQEGYDQALALRPRSLRLKKKLAGQVLSALLAGAGEDRAEDQQRARTFIEEVLAVNTRDSEALAWQARLLVVEERFDEVVELLRPVSELAEPPIDALRVLGVAYERLGDGRASAEHFVRVVEQLTRTGYEGEHVDTRAQVGDWRNAIRSCLRAGRVDQAADFGQRAIAAWPASGPLRAEFGRALLQRGDVSRGLRDLVAAKREFPDNADVRYLLASAYEGMKKLEQAEQEYQAALADLPVVQSGTRRRYFEFLARTGRAEQAEEGLLALIAASPNDADGHLRLGDFYLRLRPRRSAAARKQYEQAVALAPEDPAPLLRLAELDFASAETDPEAFLKAEATVKRFLERLPSSPFAPYLKGKLALAAGRLDEAIALLEEYAVLRPRDSAGPYYRALALRKAERITEALEAMELAYRASGGSADIGTQLATLRFEAGMKAFETGDFELARSLLAQAEQGGAQQGSKLFLAGAHANAGQFDLSEKACRELLAEDPENKVAVHLLAAVLIRKGKREALNEAEQLFRRALRNDSSDVLAAVGVASVQFLTGAYAESLASFQAVYPRTNAEGSVAMGIAQCMALLGNASGAAEFLDGEIKAHPERSDLLHIKADFLVHLELYEDAARTYMRAFAADESDVVAMLAAAAAHVQRRDYETARRLLVEHLGVKRDRHRVHLALSDVLLALGQVDEAADEMRKALALAPDHPRALLMLGKVAEHRGKQDEARRLYRECTETRTPEAEPFIRLAQILDAEGKDAQAIEAYESALLREPRNAAARNNLALLLSEGNVRLEEALEHARVAFALRSETPQFGDTYGWLLLRNGSTTRAAELLEKAARRLPQDAEVNYHAGMALARLRRTSDALTHLERALRLAPEAEWAKAVRAEIDKLR